MSTVQDARRTARDVGSRPTGPQGRLRDRPMLGGIPPQTPFVRRQITTASARPIQTHDSDSSRGLQRRQDPRRSTAAPSRDPSSYANSNRDLGAEPSLDNGWRPRQLSSPVDARTGDGGHDGAGPRAIAGAGPRDTGRASSSRSGARSSKAAGGGRYGAAVAPPSAALRGSSGARGRGPGGAGRYVPANGDLDEDGPLKGSLAEELRNLEQMYGAANRTRSGYRTRRERIERKVSLREALYGPRHLDSDVRLLVMRREMAAEGRVRRRGRFADDDAMPRRSTWHKLAPGMQQQILDERAAALHEAVGLPRPAGRRLYVAAPSLLCDITFSVAARLRALAARLGWTVEAAAAAVAARPLLGELRLDLLEVCAAEVAVWLGGQPLQVVVQRLVAEPSLAAEGPAPLLARGKALCDAAAITPAAALQLLLQQPRLMAVDPGDFPARVAAARRVVRLAVRAAAQAAAPGAQLGAAPAAARMATAMMATTSAEGAGLVRLAGRAGGLEFPVSLLLCGEAQMGRCLAALQKLLGMSAGDTAALLLAQPALAQQPPSALEAAVRFLASRFPPPPWPPLLTAVPLPQQQSDARLPPSPKAAAAAAHSAPRLAVEAGPSRLTANPNSWAKDELETEPGAASRAPREEEASPPRPEAVLAALLPFLQLAPLPAEADGDPPAQPLRPPHRHPRSHLQDEDPRALSAGTSRRPAGGPGEASRQLRRGRRQAAADAEASASEAAPVPAPPPWVVQLVARCPDVLLLQPGTAAASLDCLTRVLDGLGAAAAAAEAAAASAPAVRHGRQASSAPGPGRYGSLADGARERDARKALEGRGAARRAAAALVAAAPRLLLCRLLPPSEENVSAYDGARPEARQRSALGLVSVPLPEKVFGNPKERQRSLLAWAQAVDEAQWKRLADAACVALDTPDWPAPVLALPYVYDKDDDGNNSSEDAAPGRSGGGPAAPPAPQRAPRRGMGDRGDSDGDVVAAVAAASLLADAAAVGAVAVPIDLAVREAEVLQLFGLRGPDMTGARPGADGRPDASAHPLAAGMSAGSLNGAGDRDAGPYGMDGVRGGRDRSRQLRPWLWQYVFTAAPALLLLPSARISAAAEILCTWLGIVPAALAQYLLPYHPHAQQQQQQQPSTPQLLPPPPLPRHHVMLLTFRPEHLTEAAYGIWNWLGGGAFVDAADVAAVLRVLPGMLYDKPTMRICAAVLHAALGGRLGHPGPGLGGVEAGRRPLPQRSTGAERTALSEGQEEVSSPQAEAPDWVLVSPPVPRLAAPGPSPPPQAVVPVMPPEAAALLLLHPEQLLREGVLRLLGPAPAAGSGEERRAGWPAALQSTALASAPADDADRGPGPVTAWGEVAAPEQFGWTGDDSAGGDSGGGKLRPTLLGLAVGRLSEVLGIGRLAAAAMVLATGGQAAELALALPASAAVAVSQAMARVRRGGTWRRELSRYLYGSTDDAYGGGGLYDTSQGESLGAVSASAPELLVALREWRRAGRLAALEAAGMSDAISFTQALQLREEEWQDLAWQLDLGDPAAEVPRDMTGGRLRNR